MSDAQSTDDSERVWFFGQASWEKQIAFESREDAQEFIDRVDHNTSAKTIEFVPEGGEPTGDHDGELIRNHEPEENPLGEFAREVADNADTGTEQEGSP